MNRIIEGQIIASTAVDRHGEQLFAAQLERFVAQMPPWRLLNLNHDLTQPPIARAFNNRIDTLPDGTVVIRSDVEVLDEARFAGTTGMSISFHSYSDAVPAPPVAVSFNPRYVNRARLEAVLSSSGFADQAGLAERSEKALIPVAVFVFVLVSHGFWEEAGADLWRLCKRLALEAFGDKEDGDVALTIKAGEGRPEVIVLLSRDLEEFAEPFDLDAIVVAAESLAPANTIVKIVARVDASGAPQVDFAVDDAGTTLRRSE